MKVTAPKTDQPKKELLTEKTGSRLSKFFQWLVKGSESNPPCRG
jgi:hypothetical protein